MIRSFLEKNNFQVKRDWEVLSEKSVVNAMAAKIKLIKRQALLAPQGDVDEEGSIFMSLAGYPNQRVIENVGEAFDIFVKKLFPSEDEDEKEDGGSSSKLSDSVDDSSSEALDAEAKKNFEKKRHAWAISGEDADHYEIMGLGDLRWEATSGQIKKAYRKVIFESYGA